MISPDIFDFESTVNRRATGSAKWEKYGDKDVLPMWVADMEFATAPQIIDAMKHRLDHPILGYTNATESLTSTVIEYLARRHQWQVDRDWITYLPGVVPGIAACTLMVEPEDEILVFTPVYHPLLILPKKNARQRVDIPLQYLDGRWTVDFEAFRNAITARSKMLLLCSPHNPVGTMFSEKELTKIVEICVEHKILLVSDEIHCDLVLHKQKIHKPTGLVANQLGDNVLTLMSPSKTFNLAGANCSFAIIPDAAIRQRFMDQCLYTVPTVPTLSYTAAEAAYQHGWSWHQQLIEHLRGNLQLLKQEVTKTPYLWMDDTEATYLAWINTSELPVENPQEFFINAGVGLSPGAQFGDSHYQRLNFACSRQQLQQGISRIQRAVRNLTS